MIGCFGRKEKESNYLGHVATQTLKNANAHNIIVKQRPVPLPPKGQPATWVIATDNSPCARHALDLVLSLMHPDDKLYIFYAAKYESFANRVKKYHEEQLEKTGRQGEFVFEHVQGRCVVGLVAVCCKWGRQTRDWLQCVASGVGRHGVAASA